MKDLFHGAPPLRAAILSATLLVASAAGACAASLSDIQGLWRSQGYGYIADVSDDRLRLIEHAPTGCLVSDSYSASALRRMFDLHIAGDAHFTLKSDGVLSAVRFDRIDEADFEALCPSGTMRRTHDPELNFEVLWRVFDEHYAFFDERGVDWRETYETYRPMVDASTGRGQFRRIAHEMLRSLNDGHVWLWAGSHAVGGNPSPLERRLSEECRAISGCNARRHYNAQIEAFEAIIQENYLDGDFETAFNRSATWGALTDDIGYLRLESMSGLQRRGGSAADDIARAATLIPRVLDDLDDPDALVIDIRINEGGYDAVSFAIAGAFVDEPTQVGSKHAFYKDENGARRRTAATPLVVEPSGAEAYDGDVVLLVSSETVSAAEIFALAMRELPNVTLVGEPTQGILSDTFSRTLPNGWEVSLSNEVYLSADGAAFEAIGVPPDAMAPFLSLDDRKNDRDAAIEMAIELLSTE